MNSRATRLISLAILLCTGVAAMGAPLIESSGFIFESGPFRSCHASTIAETKEGLIAAWFGGTDEGKPDVTIWTARHDGKMWSAPVEVATGVQADGGRFPCW